MHARNNRFLPRSAAFLATVLVALVAAGCGSSDDGRAGIEPLPMKGQAGGALSAAEIAGNLAYLAVGPRVAIWDIAVADAPTLLGETAPLSDNVADLAVAGNHVYAVSWGIDGRTGDLHAIDATDPAAPRLTASIRIAPEGEFSRPLALAAHAGKLYVADQDQGIFVYSLADPALPALAASAPVTGVTGLLQVVGDRLYYGGKTFFGSVLVGALALADLAPLGQVELFSAQTIGGITSNHLIVATGLGGIGVQVVDLSDLDNPATRFQDDSGRVQSYGFAVDATTAWLPDYEFDRVHVLDLSNPAAVAYSAASVPAVGTRVAAAGGNRLIALTQLGGMTVYDIGAPLDPAAGKSVEASLCVDCLSVQGVDATLFVGAGYGGLRIADLAELQVMGSHRPGGFVNFEDVAVAGGVAYVADWAFGLRTVDVANPGRPFAVGGLATGGFPSSVALAGTTVYVGESTNGGALRVIDATNPAAPVERGAALTSKAHDVVVRDERAYVADQSLFDVGGLRIYSVADPRAPLLIGHYENCPNATGVALAGNYAILGCADDRTFHIVDVDLANPANPAHRAGWALDGLDLPWAVAVEGGRAYLGSDTGVVVIDIADPLRPTLVTKLPTAGPVRGISVLPDRIVAAAGIAGVYQWPLP